MDQKHNEEYNKALEVWKQMGTIQLALLSVFVAFMLAGVAFLFGKNAPTGEVLKYARLGMALLASCFFIIQESHMYVLKKMLIRMSELELKLDYKLFSVLPGMPGHRFAPATLSLRFLYAISFFWWLYWYLKCSSA